ncbi:heavy-metal-associated domain-containing protein [Saccharothrix sp. S26]|uniref:heavy-metal-associated domain-containing protein n=1 Tax=Saccharothrix sp. S26 TaxID=2907215 RepID=UPI001F2157EC|nr:heavy metal-associated domain-containing protein [Saccharothrix sp. S26]MCE7000751.1 heavy-metal-associated domain-containing protein [Saccharothrix sp. S26]
MPDSNDALSDEAPQAGLDFVVKGMTCEGCAARVTNAARRVPGATRVKLDLDAATLRVLGSTDAAAITAAVKDAGYVLERG